MRNGILLNNKDKIDFTLFSIQSGLADLSVNSDSIWLCDLYKKEKSNLSLDFLSKLFLFDEFYIVQPDMYVDYNKIKNYIDLHIIEEDPIRDLDNNYAAYIKSIVMQTLSTNLHIKKENRLFPLLEEMYDSLSSLGSIDLDIRKKFLDAYGKDVFQIAKLNLDVPWEDNRLLWNLFSSKIFESIWHYTNELILNIEYSSLKDLVISGSHMRYTDFIDTESELECYKILKVVVNEQYSKTPSFSSIDDMLKFKENNYWGIISLRNEISNLESVLRKYDSQQAIRKAEADVLKAQVALLRNSNLNRASKIATYLSIPVGIMDSMQGSFLGLSLSVVGTITTALSDINTFRNNWINILH